MDCLNPITLKSGLIVPCGQCLNCLSAKRAELSIRLQIHTKYYNGSTMMITLTYDNDHLVYGNDMTLFRPHVSEFIKSYKRKNNLHNDVFTYFGCGEYGDRFSRPHYHLVFFGDSVLERLFWQDIALAEEHLRECWPHGNVWCGIADVSGIHYVCKYVMKEDINQISDQLPFPVYSKKLGASWFQSDECALIRRKLEFLSVWKDEIYKNCPHFDKNDRDSLLAAKEYFSVFVPSWKVVLDSGKVVRLPRYFRKQLVGSFQHWKDNPLWLPNYIDTLIRSNDFYRENDGRIDTAVRSRISRAEQHAIKIQQNLVIRKYNKQHECL